MSEPPISRGFRGRSRAPKARACRRGSIWSATFRCFPPGRRPRPTSPAGNSRLEDGQAPIGEWSWAEFNALPQTEVTVDIHCVTTWSKLDTHWRGVSIDTLLEAAGLSEPPGPLRLIAHCDGGYTTNVPLEDLLDGKAMIATHYEGRAARSRAWRAGAAVGAASLFLEEREMGAQACNSSTPSSPASGRSSATTSTAIPGASSVMPAIEQIR